MREWGEKKNIIKRKPFLNVGRVQRPRGGAGAGAGVAESGSSKGGGAQVSRHLRSLPFEPGSPDLLWGGGPGPGKLGQVVSWLKTFHTVAPFTLLLWTPSVGRDPRVRGGRLLAACSQKLRLISAVAPPLPLTLCHPFAIMDGLVSAIFIFRGQGKRAKKWVPLHSVVGRRPQCSACSSREHLHPQTPVSASDLWLGVPRGPRSCCDRPLLTSEFFQILVGIYLNGPKSVSAFLTPLASPGVSASPWAHSRMEGMQWGVAGFLP